MPEVTPPTDPLNPTPSEVYLGIEATLNKNFKAVDDFNAAKRQIDQDTASEVNDIFTSMYLNERQRQIQRKGLEALKAKREAKKDGQ